MLATCKNCGRGLLTEADLIIYQHKPSEEYYSCGCVEIDRLREALEAAEARIQEARDTILRQSRRADEMLEQLEDAEAQAARYMKELESCANFMRGMQLDRTIPSFVMNAINARLSMIEQALKEG